MSSRLKKVQEILGKKKPGEIKNFIEFFYMFSQEESHLHINKWLFQHRHLSLQEKADNLNAETFDCESMPDPVLSDFKKLKRMWNNRQTQDEFFTAEELKRAERRRRTLKIVHSLKHNK